MDERQLAWRKSSWSGTEGNCVEIALTEETAFIRDSKDRAGGTITMSAAAWSELVNSLELHA